MPELRLRDRILHATAGWHTTTDPACVEYKPTKEGTRLDRNARGRGCHICMSSWMVRPEPTARVICPECDESVVVPIHVELIEDDFGVQMVTTPDMTDLWAHVWTHDGGDDE